MGQIIDFHERRVRKEAGPSAASSIPTRSPPVSYVETVLVPAMEFWRLVAASYAGLWLAPFGLEVRPTAGRESSEPRARARSQR